MGDRFYLCDNKILCEYDYEERLVFANIAYNPSSLAHIRRQVSNLQVIINKTNANPRQINDFSFFQPPGDHHPQAGSGAPVYPSANALPGRPIMSSPSNPPLSLNPPQGHKPSGSYFAEKPLCGHSGPTAGGMGSNTNGIMCNGSIQPKDDGSSGYGSPDSEIVDAGQAQ